MSKTDNIESMFKPDAAAIKQHLEFICAGMDDYCDGCIEIAYGNAQNIPCLAQQFPISDLNAVVKFACEKNIEGRNIYVVGAVLNPEMCESPEKQGKRSNDADFYSTSVVWADIDSASSAEAIRQRYEKLPPSLIIVTGREPNIRTHLWWKLAEPIADAEELREVLDGLAVNLGGDPMVKNPTSLMRLGGTVNWQSEKKRSRGRRIENTEVRVPSNATKLTMVDSLLLNYPAPSESLQVSDLPVAPSVPLAQHADNSTLIGKLGLIEIKDDGREQYMHKMLCATIVHLTADLKRWPTADEVFADAWPIYSSKVLPRAGMSLDQEGRGARVMRSKIRSKLGAFARGRIRGATSIEEIIRNNPQQTLPATISSAEGKASIDPLIRSKTITYTLFNDIKPVIEMNEFVRGFFIRGGMSVVYGESNCGKTFFMMDLAFHVALGKKWRDRRVEGGGVVYIALEGAHGLANRLEAFKRENPSVLDMPLAMIPSQVNFASADGNITELIDVINEIKGRFGSIQLVVVDTLARALLGGDENDGQDMGMLVANGDRIRAATGAHICFVHHTGKDKARGARGHSSLRAAVDAEIEVSREEGQSYSTVKTSKQRDLEKADDLFFSLKQITLGVNKYNEEVKSCIVVPLSQEELPKSSYSTDERMNPRQEAVYNAIVAALDGYSKNIIPFSGAKSVNAIDFERLRVTLADRGFARMVERENDTPETIAERVRSATESARITLQKLGKISFNKNYVWLTEPSKANSNNQIIEADFKRVDPLFSNEFPEII